MRYFLPTVEIKDNNIMIDGQTFFDQPVKNNLRTYDNIKKIPIRKRDDSVTSCSIDYPYLKEHYKMTAKDLRQRCKFVLF